MGKQKIIRNAAKCLSCNTVIESRHRHDFSMCKCVYKNSPEEETYIFVDGGKEYLRFGAGQAAIYETLYVWE